VVEESLIPLPSAEFLNSIRVSIKKLNVNNCLATKLGDPAVE
jgi:hypothetical protein